MVWLTHCNRGSGLKPTDIKRPAGQETDDDEGIYEEEGNLPSDNLLSPQSPPLVDALVPAKQNAVFVKILDKIERDNCTAQRQGQPTIRFITSKEYLKIINNAFEVNLKDDAFAGILPAETVVLGYDHLRDFNLASPEKLKTLMQANQTVAKSIEQAQFQGATQCGKAAEACLQDWLTQTLPLLWQGDVSADVIKKEADAFKARGGDQAAFGQTIERLLLSPYFLYRQKIGGSGRLTDWEVATTLSESLWDMPVDRNLKTLVDNKGLSNPTAVANQAKAMIQSPNFYRGLKRFVSSWLEHEDLTMKDYTEVQNFNFSDSMKTDLVNETAGFLYYMLRANNDSLSQIFSANFTMGTPGMAQQFGLTAAPAQVVPGLPQGFAQLSFPEGRQGLLSQPSVVMGMSDTSKTNPALRGKHVLSRFLCHNLETPENLQDVVANTKFDPTVSVKQAFQNVTSSGTCAECHQYVNGVGFGMENISPVGLVRARDDHSQPVDAAGELLTLSGKRLEFSGVAGLSKTLGTTIDAEVCMVVQVFRMVHGRLEKEEDTCSIAESYKKSKASGFRFHEIFTNVILDDAYLNRK